MRGIFWQANAIRFRYDANRKEYQTLIVYNIRSAHAAELVVL